VAAAHEAVDRARRIFGPVDAWVVIAERLTLDRNERLDVLSLSNHAGRQSAAHYAAH